MHRYAFFRASQPLNFRLMNRHRVIILQPIRCERDLIFGRGAKIDLDLVTAPVLKLLRSEWRKDPFSLGGDVIYLFNKNLPRPLSTIEKDTPTNG